MRIILISVDIIQVYFLIRNEHIKDLKKKSVKISIQSYAQHIMYARKNVEILTTIIAVMTLQEY